MGKPANHNRPLRPFAMKKKKKYTNETQLQTEAQKLLSFMAKKTNAGMRDLPPSRAASPPYEQTSNQCKQLASGRRESSAVEEIKEERAKEGAGAESY